MTSPRKTITITRSELSKMRAFSAAAGSSMSTVAREWLAEYVEHGISATPIEPEEVYELQVVIDPALAARAEQRAAQEGLTLRDVIRHEIAALDEL